MNENINKKQNRKMTVFALILSALSIGLLVFGFFLVSSDKVVMLQSVSNLTSKLNNVLEDNSLLNKMASNNDVGLYSNILIKADSLNLNSKITLDYLENKEDKKSNLSLKMSTTDNNIDVEMLDLNAILANNNAYLFLEDVTPKYYYGTLEYFTIFSKLTGDDYEKVITILKEAITNSIDNKDIEKEKVTIKYNGNDKKVNKLKYKITNETIHTILEKMTNSIEKDKKLLDHLSSSINIKSDELIKNLKESLKQMKNTEIENSLNYQVYYYGFNKIIRYEIADEKENFMLQYSVEDKEIINFYFNKEILFNIEINKTKKQYKFNGYVMIGDKIPFSGTYDNDKFELNIQEELKLIIDSKQSEENNEYHSNINISVSMSNQEIVNLKIESKYYFGEKVKLNLTDSTKIDNITEEEMNILMENLNDYPLYQIIQELYDNLNLDYNFQL